MRWTALVVALTVTVLPAVAGAEPAPPAAAGSEPAPQVAAGAEPRTSAEVQRELELEQQRADELGVELGEVRVEIAGAETELAEIGARLADARGQLRAAEGQVALGEAALEEARADQAEAEQAHDRAEQVLEHTEVALAVEESILTDQIVQSFKYGTVGATRGAMMLEVLRRAEDPNSFSVGMKQLKVVVDTQEGTVQRVFQLRDERVTQTDDAARARAHAVQAAATAKDVLRHLETLRDEAAALTAQIAADEERQRVVLASLKTDEAETAALLARVAARQAELEHEYARRRAEEEAARIAAEEREAARRRAAQRAAQRSATSAASGAGGGPSIGEGFCPVQGAIAGRDFSNDWGYPRSGGRTHQGNDIFASQGTPIVAIQAGVVVRTSTVDRGLGGITVTYQTADGSEWYNAHLSAIAEGIVPGVSVAAGQTIGLVGKTGNARTTPPHNHIGRRLDGVWFNPYPTIAPLCR